MPEPTLTISIDRTALALTPLVLSGRDDGSPLGVTDFTEPGRQPRIVSISSDHQHGDNPLRWSYQQAVLTFSAFPEADDEATAQAALEELRAAITQGLRYEVTVTISDAPPKVWTCNPGTLSPPSRDYLNLKHHFPVWSVTLPCHPIPA